MRIAATKKPTRIATIKQKASEVILERFPIARQLNLLMTAVLLVNKKADALLADAGLDPLTPAEKLKEAELVQAATWIRRQRTHSGALENDVVGGKDTDLGSFPIDD